MLLWWQGNYMYDGYLPLLQPHLVCFYSLNTANMFSINQCLPQKCFYKAWPGQSTCPHFRPTIPHAWQGMLGDFPESHKPTAGTVSQRQKVQNISEHWLSLRLAIAVRELETDVPSTSRVESGWKGPQGLSNPIPYVNARFALPISFLSNAAPVSSGKPSMKEIPQLPLFHCPTVWTVSKFSWEYPDAVAELGFGL